MKKHWEEGEKPDLYRNILPSKTNAKLIIAKDENHNMRLYENRPHEANWKNKASDFISKHNGDAWVFSLDISKLKERDSVYGKRLMDIIALANVGEASLRVTKQLDGLITNIDADQFVGLLPPNLTKQKVEDALYRIQLNIKKLVEGRYGFARLKFAEDSNKEVILGKLRKHPRFIEKIELSIRSGSQVSEEPFILFRKGIDEEASKILSDDLLKGIEGVEAQIDFEVLVPWLRWAR